MARSLKFAAILAGLISFPARVFVYGLHPNKSLVVANKDPRIGLLEQGGRTQVVSVPSDEKEVISITVQHARRGRFTHVKASLLTLGLFGVLIRNLWMGSTNWAAFIFLWIIYMFESFHCSTRRYLSNIQTPMQVKDLVTRLQEAPPRVRWHVECYHYEDDYYRGGKYASRRGHVSTSSTTKQVTHRASDLYMLQQWRDLTNTTELLESLQYGSNQKATYLKISLAKLITFENKECYQDFMMQQDRFIAREGHRDFCRDSWTCIEVDGFISKMLAVRTVIGSEAHVRMPVFWLCTALLLTVPYRVWFSRNCDEADLVIIKEISGSP